MAPLFGPRVGGGSRIRGGGGLPPGVVDPLSPARSGSPDVIAQRQNLLVGPGMLHAENLKDGNLPDKNVDHTAIAANFTFTPDNGAHALAVQFTDTSVGSAIDLYEWDFGDGSPISNAKSPLHSFAVAGVYDVSLTVSRSGSLGPNRDKSTKTVVGAVTVT